MTKLKNSKKFNFTAQTVLILLSITLLLTVGAGAGAFYVAKKKLSAYADSTALQENEADTSEASVSKLRQLKVILDDNTQEREQAKNIAVENQKYEYQDQILILDKYAKETGVHISTIDYSTGLTTQPSTTTPKPTPKPENGGTVTKDNATAAKPVALQTKKVSISLAQPVRYSNLLLFIRRIEQSPVRMQIANISVSADAESNGILVSPQALTIDIYVREQ